jgi:hypothetical protein
MNDLTALAGIAWKSLDVQGFNIGPGEVQTTLEKGLLKIKPLELPFSDGVVRIAPTIDVTKSPSIVTLAPGTIVDQVRISPEMCRTWLKYVAPLAAEATAAEGRFSVQLEDAVFPANNPTGGNIQGKLAVHSARVGPGPLAQQIVVLVEQAKAVLAKRAPIAASQDAGQWLEIPQQQVNLQVTEQRVYHRDLQMTIKDIVIRTQGWVGVDPQQQLSLVAEVPIRDEWISQDRYLASLGGQSIKIPITGSLTRPQFDQRALTELTRQTIRDAGTNFLQEQLNRGLERLLPKGPQPQPQIPPRP